MEERLSSGLHTQCFILIAAHIKRISHHNARCEISLRCWPALLQCHCSHSAHVAFKTLCMRSPDVAERRLQAQSTLQCWCTSLPERCQGHHMPI